MDEKELLAAYGVSLTDRADGVRGHFCLRRPMKGGGYVEHWNDYANKWTAFGSLYIGREAALTRAAEIVGP